MKKIVILIIAISSYSSIFAQNASNNSDYLGKDISELAFYDLDDNTILLSTFRGKYLYVDFWFSACKPCVAEAPSAKLLKDTLKNENIVFINVSIDLSKDKWKEAISKYEITGTNLWTGPMSRFKSVDEINAYYERLNIHTFPRYMIVNPEGIVINANASRPSEYLENNQIVDEILKDRRIH